MRCFVDTSAWFALLNPREIDHRAVSAVYRSLLEQGATFTTTTAMLGELYTLSVSRYGIPQGHFWTFLERCRQSPRIQVIHPHTALVEEAWRLLQDRNDKTYSFVDALSFVVMKENGISTALTLNRHFAQERFEVLPATPTTLHEKSAGYSSEAGLPQGP